MPAAESLNCRNWRSKRLVGEAFFRRALRRGRRRRIGPFALHVFRDRDPSSESQGARLGIVASRRAGRAVRRNRAKRLIREVFRARYHELPSGDYVLRMVGSLETCRDAELTAALCGLFAKPL